MELQHGGPENRQERLPKEQRVYDFLDGLGVSYDRVDHKEAMTMEDCAAIDLVLGAPTCKNLLLCNRQNTAFYLLLMPGDKPFKTKELSKQIDSSRLSFASGGYMEQFLDITPGSLSVLGLMNDKQMQVKLLVDGDILREAYFGCHPCINTTTLKLQTQDLLNRIIPAMEHPMTIVELPWCVE